MFADPITITIAGVGKTLARISTKDTSAVYATADGEYTLHISHSVSGDGKIRTLSKLIRKKVVADPLTAVNDYEELVTQSVSERPSFGFTVTEVKDQLTGFNTWHAASGSQDKLFNKES